MAGPDRFDSIEDDYDDLPREKRRNSGNPLVIVIAVIVGVVALGVLVCGGLFFMRGSSVQVAQQQATVVPAPAKDTTVTLPAGAIEGDTKRIYSRDEFKQLVMGKTQDEIVAALGNPTWTTDAEDGILERWSYNERVLNPATGKPENGRIDFANGKAVAVSW